MVEICEICVLRFVSRIIQLEKVISDWNLLDDIELLLAIGEPPNAENMLHIKLAREQL